MSQGLKNPEMLVAWNVKESFNVRLLHSRVPNIVAHCCGTSAPRRESAQSGFYCTQRRALLARREDTVYAPAEVAFHSTRWKSPANEAATTSRPHDHEECSGALPCHGKAGFGLAVLVEGTVVRPVPITPSEQCAGRSRRLPVQRKWNVPGTARKCLPEPPGCGIRSARRTLHVGQPL